MIPPPILPHLISHLARVRGLGSGNAIGIAPGDLVTLLDYITHLEAHQAASMALLERCRPALRASRWAADIDTQGDVAQFMQE